MTVFVDTNVLVYSRDRSEGSKQERALDWLHALWESREGRVSYQILQEFYVTVTMKLKPGMPSTEARAYVRDLLTWRPIAPSAATLERAWSTQDRYKLSFWDALVVASAALSGCDRLLTEDLQDGLDVDGVLIVDPFRHEPSS